MPLSKDAKSWLVVVALFVVLIIALTLLWPKGHATVSVKYNGKEVEDLTVKGPGSEAVAADEV